MPESLVQSQFDALEPLGDEEAGVVLDFRLPVAELVDAFLRTSSVGR
jgi:gluconokinase